MRKINIVLILLFTVFFSFSAFPQENITITTYYPSPMGVYENLRFFPTTAVPACDANNEGVTYYDNNTNLLMVCRQTGTAPDTYAFQSAGSLWLRIGTTTVPGGADPVALRPIDTNLRVGIGDINVAWNRENMLTVTDNTSTNNLNEQIALAEVSNPRRGSSGTWSGARDSVAALLLSPGASQWQIRADEFDSSLPINNVNAGTFMIHQDQVATRLVIRNDGDVGIGTTTPQARLDVAGEVRVGNTGLGCNANTVGAVRYNAGEMQYCDGSAVPPAWRSVSPEFALAVRNDAGAIVVIRGPASAFVRIDNSVAHPSVGWTTPGLDGVRCNTADGWHVTGCWTAVFYDEKDSDIALSLDGNGCVTNDFDNHEAGLTIACQR